VLQNLYVTVTCNPVGEGSHGTSLLVPGDVYGRDIDIRVFVAINLRGIRGQRRGVIIVSILFKAVIIVGAIIKQSILIILAVFLLGHRIFLLRNVHLSSMITVRMIHHEGKNVRFEASGPFYCPALCFFKKPQYVIRYGIILTIY